MTTPSPGQPTDEQKAQVLYVFERQEAIKRWKDRGMWVAYGAAAVAFVVTLAVAVKLSPDIGFVVFFLAIGVAYAAMQATAVLVMPRFSRPALRCPYCAGPVPLIQEPRPFRAFEPLTVCPNCQHALP
jgi:hypothetical protein